MVPSFPEKPSSKFVVKCEDCKNQTEQFIGYDTVSVVSEQGVKIYGKLFNNNANLLLDSGAVVSSISENFVPESQRANI